MERETKSRVTTEVNESGVTLRKMTDSIGANADTTSAKDAPASQDPLHEPAPARSETLANKLARIRSVVAKSIEEDHEIGQLSDRQEVGKAPDEEATPVTAPIDDPTVEVLPRETTNTEKPESVRSELPARAADFGSKESSHDGSKDRVPDRKKDSGLSSVFSVDKSELIASRHSKSTNTLPGTETDVEAEPEPSILEGDTKTIWSRALTAGHPREQTQVIPENQPEMTEPASTQSDQKSDEADVKISRILESIKRDGDAESDPDYTGRQEEQNDLNTGSSTSGSVANCPGTEKPATDKASASAIPTTATPRKHVSSTPDNPAEEQDDVDRLLNEANTKLAGKESRRRRSAIEHLKAAFRVARADDDAAPPANDGAVFPTDIAEPVKDTEKEPIHTVPDETHSDREIASLSTGVKARIDEHETDPVGLVASVPDTSTLARDKQTAAVRPNRPVASGAHERPTPQLRSAKDTSANLLMLEAEQLLETDDATVRKTVPESSYNLTPVRPRRVNLNIVKTNSGSADTGLPSEPIAETETNVQNSRTESEILTITEFSTEPLGFSDYVAEHGVSEIEDLLVCAAAYIQRNDAHPHFAHPQLMSMVRGLPEHSDLRREESLRAFGRLLRNGTFRKQDRAKFTLTQSSSYLLKENKAAV